MRPELKRILMAIIEHRDNTIVDNDFEAVHNIDHSKFKDFKYEDIIEALLLLDEILYENDIDIDAIYRERDDS